MPKQSTKNPAAVELGRKGGKAKNPRKGFGALSPAGRKEAGRQAALKRWSKRTTIAQTPPGS